MAGEAEAGDVGAGMGAGVRPGPRPRPTRAGASRPSASAIQRAARRPRMAAAKITPVPSGLVRTSLSPGFRPPLRSAAAAIDEAVHREAQRRFRPFAGMAADQGAARLVEHAARARQHLEQVFLHQPLGGGRHDGQRQRAVRLGAHRPDVAQRMDGRDLAEDEGIVDEGAEEIDGLHQRLARRHLDHRRIVGRVEADRDAGKGRGPKPGQHALEQPGADLGAAAAAAHADVGQQALGVGVGQRRIGRRRACAHIHRLGRRLAIHAHPLAVDMVLPAPYPGAFDRPAAARGHGVAVAGADDRKIAALRREGLRRLAEQGAAQIVGERRALADREHAGLGAGMGRHAWRSRRRRRLQDRRSRAQRRLDGEEAAFVERQAGAGEPFGGTCLGDDEDVVGFQALAGLEMDGAAPRCGWSPRSRAAARRAAAKIARIFRCAAAAWPDRISPLVARVTATSAPRATARRRWSMASASSTPPAPPPITAMRSGPRHVFMRSRKASQRRPSSAIGLTGVACSAAPGNRRPGWARSRHRARAGRRKPAAGPSAAPGG